MSVELGQASLKRVGFKDALQVRNISRVQELPLHALEVFRSYDALHPDVQGYVASLPHLFGSRPRSLAVITDPRLGADLLRTLDFSTFNNQTAIHNANKPLRGDFILNREDHASWRADRTTANPAFSPAAVKGYYNQIGETARNALSDVLQVKSLDTLPSTWTSYLLTYQLTNLLVGEPIDKAILNSSIAAHREFTRKPFRALFLGNTGRIGGYMAENMLNPYGVLLDTMEDKLKNGSNEGIVHQVLQNIPESQCDSRDVMSTLLGGQSLLRSYVNSMLYMLSTHPELQDAVREDESILQKVLVETGRLLPPSLYKVRRTINPITLGETTFSPRSLFVFAALAYGGAKNVENASDFNPEREELNEMTNTHGGQANVYGNGPHTCLGKHLSPPLIRATVKSIVEQFDIECDNRPIPVVGGVALRFNEPLQLRLTDRSTRQSLFAPTS